MILYVTGYIIFCIVLAYFNGRFIAKGRVIHHVVNGVLHLLFFVGGFFVMGWQVAALPFIGRVVFDTSLNLFRGLPISYVTIQPASIIDQIEQAVFKRNWWLPKLIYVAIAIIILLV